MKLSSTAAAFILISALLGLGFAEGAGPQYSLAISAASGTFKKGAEVKIRIVLTNVTDHQISIGRINNVTGPEHEYALDVRDSRGRSMSFTRYGRALRGTPDPGDDRQDCIGCDEFAQELAPHENTIDQIAVTKIYDIGRPGKYTVQVSRFNDDGLKTLIKSNTITVTITN